MLGVGFRRECVGRLAPEEDADAIVMNLAAVLDSDERAVVGIDAAARCVVKVESVFRGMIGSNVVVYLRTGDSHIGILVGPDAHAAVIT